MGDCGCGRAERPERTRYAKSEATTATTPLTGCRLYKYMRVGLDEREMELCDDGVIGRGSARCEVWWRLDGETLVVGGGGSDTFTATLQPDGSYTGRWVGHEKCEVVLTPVVTEGAA